ncbi:hypothetical protein GCM10010136_01840 [Limoniibacter endophyticus]|uniref:Uncharacterized protein n=1 Tax=Limoniibacter endophyticus TaxID=1565040 RepID=A0A8J3DEP3_9HYPH|nr:hypothetical protein GCM10010136_01840 [Limoniibacter endophyticus]
MDIDRWDGRLMLRSYIKFAWWPVMAATLEGGRRLAWLEYVWVEWVEAPKSTSKPRYYTY